MAALDSHPEQVAVQSGYFMPFFFSVVQVTKACETPPGNMCIP